MSTLAAARSSPGNNYEPGSMAPAGVRRKPDCAGFMRRRPCSAGPVYAAMGCSAGAAASVLGLVDPVKDATEPDLNAAAQAVHRPSSARRSSAYRSC
jgi:hypothetical protein